MKIDNRLKLILPIEQADGSTIKVHAEPLSRDVFQMHYMAIAQTFNAIYDGGIGAVAGPRVAAHLLRDIARKSKTLDGAQGIEAIFFGEMRRLSSVIYPDGRIITLHEAIQQKVLDPEDVEWVENALTFFTVASLMHERKILPSILQVMTGLWSAQISSSNSTELANSSRTSTAPENTGVTIFSAEPAPAAVQEETQSFHPS